MKDNGQDILLSRLLTKDEIIDGFCNAFHLHSSEFVLSDTIENTIGNNDVKLYVLLCV
jgi:hypothetical protein